MSDNQPEVSAARECAIHWNGLSRQGEYVVGHNWPTLSRDSVTIAVPFIEKSAYEALREENEKLRIKLASKEVIEENQELLRRLGQTEPKLGISATEDNLRQENERLRSVANDINNQRIGVANELTQLKSDLRTTLDAFDCANDLLALMDEFKFEGRYKDKINSAREALAEMRERHPWLAQEKE